MEKPTHPDMDLMEKVLQGQDARAEGNVPLDELQPINPEVLMYAAHQRTIRAGGMHRHHEPEIVRAALWLDGFAAGAAAQRRKDGKR